VVAVLVNDGSAPVVASAAVTEAVRLHAPVRFLQIVASQHNDEGRSLAEEMLFRAGLRALHGHPRTPSVFEVVRSRTAAVIRTCSRDAALLVVGDDESGSGGERCSLADICRSVATCPVRAVPVPAEPPR
jgi:hypothetical protein